MRTYKRKRSRQWADKDKRMSLAVRMRGEGRSLREIGAELAVNHETVRRDLARWDAQQAAPAPANVVSLSQKLSHLAVATDPEAERHATPECDTRTTGEALGLTPGEERIARAVAFLTERGA